MALGATAAQSLLGKAVPITKMRGEVIERDDGLRVFLTIHPSFILRIPDARDKEAERARFLKDMKAGEAADGGVDARASALLSTAAHSAHGALQTEDERIRTVPRRFARSAGRMTEVRCSPGCVRSPADAG